MLVGPHLEAAGLRLGLGWLGLGWLGLGLRGGRGMGWWTRDWRVSAGRRGRLAGYGEAGAG